MLWSSTSPVPTAWGRGGWDSPVGRCVWLVELVNTGTYNSSLNYISKVLRRSIIGPLSLNLWLAEKNIRCLEKAIT